MKSHTEVFIEEHGGADSAIIDGSRTLLPDGAFIEGSGQMALCWPPEIAKPAENARRIQKYWAAKVRLAKQRFSTRKKELLQQASAGSAYVPNRVKPEAAQKELHSLKIEVLKCVDGYRTAQKALDEMKPKHLAVKKEKQMENREKNNELLEAINAVEI